MFNSPRVIFEKGDLLGETAPEIIKNTKIKREAFIASEQNMKNIYSSSETRNQAVNIEVKRRKALKGVTNQTLINEINDKYDMQLAAIRPETKVETKSKTKTIKNSDNDQLNIFFDDLGKKC